MFALPESPSDGGITGLSNQQMQTAENNIIGGPREDSPRGGPPGSETKKLQAQTWGFQTHQCFLSEILSLNLLLGPKTPEPASISDLPATGVVRNSAPGCHVLARFDVPPPLILPREAGRAAALK